MHVLLLFVARLNFASFVSFQRESEFKCRDGYCWYFNKIHCCIKLLGQTTLVLYNTQIKNNIYYYYV